MAHAIFDSDQLASVSYANSDKSDPLEFRANRFASCYLMPPAFLARLPSPSLWSDDEVVEWANKLRVSCEALGYALKSAKLIDWKKCSHIRTLRVPREDKIDPELPETLSPSQRERKERLLDLGLSDFYIALCFDALHQGAISTGRLAEALLSSEAEAAEIAALYGRTLYVD
jgi:Zn-dependent peptidase ImmA (M78 family)